MEPWSTAAGPQKMDVATFKGGVARRVSRVKGGGLLERSVFLQRTRSLLWRVLVKIEYPLVGGILAGW